MKKIWPWLLLLFLLILFCVWTKKDSIHLSSHSETTASYAAPDITQKKRYINYTITQRDTDYLLNGNFTNTQQQQALGDTVSSTGSTLSIKNTSSNATLLGEEAIALTNKILPHFIKNYQNGKIVYHNNKLSIYGDASSYEAQHEMQRLLNTSTLLSQDNSSVLVEKPIHFAITKKAEAVDFKGTFNDVNQSNALKSKLPNTTSLHLSQAPHHVDKGAVAITEKILSFFMEKYRDGAIVYENETLSVSGMVPSQEDLDAINRLLSQTNISVVNHTTVDQEALAQAKREAQRLLQLEAQRKAQEEAQREVQEKLEAQRRTQEEAKIEAQNKAQEEAQRVAQEKREAQRRAQEEAVQAKKKITQLLQIENIEFEVAKAALTPLGKGTVDHLAKILAKYPHISVEIAGHTDSDGSAEFNQKLSQARVDTVKGRLIARGIHAGRLTAKGYGESQPLVPNTSNANKQKNRRVEFNIQGE